MPHVWLIRHSQPLVAPGVCYGATEVPADPAATQTAAAAIAKVLAPGTRVVSSPLQRCDLLTQALQKQRPDLTFNHDTRLREMDFGDWEGQRWEAIDRVEIDAWTAEFETWRCGCSGECVRDVMQRVAAAWDETVSSAQPTAWITHAGVIRAVTLIAQGVRRATDASRWPKDAPGFGQWWKTEVGPADVNPAAPRCTPPPRPIS